MISHYIDAPNCNGDKCLRVGLSDLISKSLQFSWWCLIRPYLSIPCLAPNNLRSLSSSSLEAAMPLPRGRHLLKVERPAPGLLPSKSCWLSVTDGLGGAVQTVAHFPMSYCILLPGLPGACAQCLHRPLGKQFLHLLALTAAWVKSRTQAILLHHRFFSPVLRAGQRTTLSYFCRCETNVPS